MKPCLYLLLSLSFGHLSNSQEIVKLSNTSALNLATSWSGGVVPTAVHTAVWNATSLSTFNATAVLGANLSWQGIRIDDAYNNAGKYTITGSHTLTIGSSGIGITGLNLQFDHPVVFAADAELRLNANSKGVTFNGVANLGGNTVTVVSGNNNRFIAGAGGLSNGTLLFSSGPHNGQCQFNAASVGAFNLLGTGNAQIIVNAAAASNTQLDLNLDDTSRLSLGLAFDNLTFGIGNLFGAPGTRIIPDYLQATGSPVVVRTLAVNQTIDGSFAGLLTGANNNRALGLTKNGSATLSLTNPVNEYSGPTTVNAGTLHITGAGRLNHRPVPTQPILEGIYPGVIINHGVLHIDSTAAQTLSGAMTGSGILLKSNIGFLTLAGDGSGFTGEVVVNSGRVTLTGLLGGNVSLSANTSLGGSGTSTGGLTTASGSSLILSGGSTTSGLSFHGATINSPTYVEFSSPQSQAVVYEVLRYGDGGLVGYENIVPLARGTLSHDVSDKKVVFTALAPGIRTWNIGDGVWNSAAVLENWAQGDRVFYQGDAVVFDAMASDTTITLEGVLAPSTVTVENPAHSYTLAGGGGLAGNGTFAKNSDGILRIASPSPNFAGPTSINGGIFRFIDGGSWGPGIITNHAALEADISSDLTLINGIGGNGTLVKRGRGTLTSAGATESTFTGNVTVEGGRLVLGKETALGYGNSGAKSVIIHPGAQVDLNGYADTQHKEVKKPWLTYTFRIAGDGDGSGAITNKGGGLRIPIKDFDFAGIANLVLTGDASIGGTAGYDVGFTHNVTGTIIGNGHTLTKLGSNTIHLRAAASNISLVVKEGTLGIENNNDSFGGEGGAVTVHANASLGASGPVIIPTPVTLNDGAVLRSLPNWYTDEPAVWSGPVTVHGAATLLTETKNMIITGTIGGSGGIVKSGPQLLTLQASNTYTGPTMVRQGKLIIQRPYLNDTAAVSVAAGATLQLDFTGTDTVGSLTLGGVAIEAGQICDAASHPGLLAGNGRIQVAETTSDYINWSGSSGYQLSGGPDDDDDSDGLSNFTEYAFGLNPISNASASPITATDKVAGTFTYTRRRPSLTQLAHRYECSATLAVWDPFTPPMPDVSNDGDPVESVTVTIPAALLAEPKVFFRVKASSL
jgi:autotransporter-associated beta strand protein